ncbi:hypothetical protein N7468_006730 [Penicillium chermesinum]|uniref:Uncharacterized protein n=1 Tax=Penicillium chermesinum TaxID=63820 RepID=A0A9W9NSW2_9EURO|nr:uncharacterized protein N7468_006730 [Penicillium chermesinum]KAJ5225505.1 hypothetical protein N7468_006730 [Penicillium chermesinum]
MPQDRRADAARFDYLRNQYASSREYPTHLPPDFADDFQCTFPPLPILDRHGRVHTLPKRGEDGVHGIPVTIIGSNDDGPLPEHLERLSDERGGRIWFFSKIGLGIVVALLILPLAVRSWRSYFSPETTSVSKTFLPDLGPIDRLGTVEYSCGQTAKQAQALGCVYDHLTGCWLNRFCSSRMNDEYMRYYAGKPPDMYWDAALQKKVQRWEEIEESQQSYYWTTKRDQAIRCLFLLRRAHDSFQHNRLLDNVTASDAIVNHCVGYIAEWVRPPSILPDERVKERRGKCFLSCVRVKGWEGRVQAWN